ncbi:hypothetical protein HK097_007738 [Rhizophlyctis rosea]|uniref:Uncharacterized protein n=1 Tax=Rhizophlyctis rosea TaxID=64517 RepID=A0AAD5SE91_9FUNG|nr:hypothetical protein HK097_007738 [Rhizophlyctis rosea]
MKSGCGSVSRATLGIVAKSVCESVSTVMRANVGMRSVCENASKAEKRIVCDSVSTGACANAWDSLAPNDAEDS